MKEHELSAEAKVLLYGLGQERLHKTITLEDYTIRGKRIVADDRTNCRKSCCKSYKAIS